MLKHKTIFCSYKNYELVKNKFKKKEIIPIAYCDDKFCTYVRKYPKGVFNIKVDDWSIWVPDEFPYFRRWK